MKKYLLPFLLCLKIFHAQEIPLLSASTNKALLPYEIESIQATSSGYVIEGWAMISKLQHFQNASTHTYELIVYNESEQLHYYSNPIANDQTDTMRVFNTPQCNQEQYYQNASICYYDYQNVGFQFFIPYEDLKKGKYDVKLIVHALTTQVSKSTTLFYPTHTPIIKTNNGFIYIAKSDLMDTHLQVVYNDVLERLSPNKYATVRTTSNYCGSMYGYKVYFGINTNYHHVYDRVHSDGTTYYKVGTSAQTFCARNQNQTQEGSDFYSWIPGNFVDYIGTPLTLEVIQNTPPNLTILDDPMIEVNEPFDPFDWVVAHDKEDGDLTAQIQLIEGRVEPSPGVYELVFYVEDSQKAFDIDSMYVHVMKGNTPPDISASDKVIYQYTKFDYYADVSTSDFEDGTISILWYEGEVNVEELGIYYVTYYCMDSEGLITTKTISVEVIRNPREKIRYIDPILPFYDQTIPRNWIYKYPYLFEQLENPKLFDEKHIIL